MNNNKKNYYTLFCRELARFIAAGRLHCKIDKVKGIVVTTRPDSKNWQYQVISNVKLTLDCFTINKNNTNINQMKNNFQRRIKICLEFDYVFIKFKLSKVIIQYIKY